MSRTLRIPVTGKPGEFMDLLIGDPWEKYHSTKLRYDEDGEPYVRIIDIPWRARQCGDEYYAMYNIRIHSLLLPEANQVDHIYGNGLDNRPGNLQASTYGLNGINRGRLRSNTSGYNGVSHSKSRLSPWVANIRIKGRMRYLGVFKTPEDAARAYDAALFQFYGLTAPRAFNFPEEYGLLSKKDQSPKEAA